MLESWEGCRFDNHECFCFIDATLHCKIMGKNLLV